MRYRLTGLSLPWLGAQWERVPGDKEVAQQIITFLENRRVLFGQRHQEDEISCMHSANDIRHYLTGQINAAHSADLMASLRAMRAAARQFVDAAGPNARNFQSGWTADNAFGLALGDFRTLMGVQIARIATQYDLTIEDDLAAILPPSDEDDPGWIPGFESD
jgi:uncharacterized protein DUF6650